MRFRFHIIIAFALTWTSCAKTGAKDASVKDDSETQTTAVVTPPAPAPTETGSVTPKTPTEENFLITFPTASINTAAPLAMWNESPEMKDYDIIVSLDNKCKVPLQAYGDVSIHSQQLKPLGEGTYYICVYAIQQKARLLEAKNSPFAFVVDLTPPAAPTIQDLAPGNRLNNGTPTIVWDPIASADEYNMSITTDAQCLVAVQEFEHLTTTSQVLAPLSDGSYYVCLDAADRAGNKAVASNNAMPFFVDSNNAQIINVTSTTANGAYRIGAVIPISVTFSEVVNVNTTGGTPRLLLETGTTDRYATYASGSGTNTLVFNYTVQAGDNNADIDLNVAPNQLSLNGGTILDLSQNPAGLDAPVGAEVGALSVNKNIRVDTTSPTVAQVSSPNANGSYKLGDEIQISVRFSEPVYVTDPANITLRLETGSVDRSAVYFAGTGTNTLYFNYQVQAGDSSADLATWNAAAFTIVAPATVKDEAGNNANVNVPTTGGNSLAGGKALVVDGTIPTVTGIAAVSADGVYKAGQVLTFNAVFNETVYVTNPGGLKLELNTGLTRQASYASGSGTKTLTFSYTVASGDTTLDLDNTIDPIKWTGGATVKDAVGNSADTNFAAGAIAGSASIALDTTEPDIESVTTSTANGTYKVGESIAIELNFSEIVTVTNAGSLRLKMETGSNDTEAVYASGSGSDKLVFTYKVVSGDASSDLEVESMNALSLNGATIRDAAGNDTFPLVPNSSLSGSAALVIDGVPPGAFTISGPSNPAYTSSLAVSFTNATDADKYDVIVSTTNDCATHIVDSPFNGVTAAQNVALSDGVYYVCVTARDLSGNTTTASNQPYMFEVETSAVHVVFGASGPTRLLTAKRAAGNTTTDTVQSWPGAEQLHAAASMALSTTNFPSVSYANDSGDSLFDLSMAQWNGATFDTDVVQAGGGDDIGGFSSIALNSSDVSYIPHTYKGATSDLVVSSGTPGAWSHAIPASYGTSATILDTAVAIDSNDKAHVIYTYEDSGQYYLRYVNNVGGGWGAPTAVTTGGCNQYFQGSIGLDSSDNVHLAYLCATPAGECRVYHGKYNGAWTHQLLGKVQAASCDINAMGRMHKPSLVLSSADKVFVTVFDEDADKLFLYNNTSGAFSPTELLSGKGWQAVIARDAFDKLYIAYRSSAAAGADLELITNNKGSWTGVVLDNSGTLTHIGDIVVEGVAGRSNRP